MTLRPCKLSARAYAVYPAQATALGRAAGGVQAAHGIPGAIARLTRTRCKQPSVAQAEPPMHTKMALPQCLTCTLQLRQAQAQGVQAGLKSPFCGIA